jgi:thiol-disulfide isomerase/thioredoxin
MSTDAKPTPAEEAGRPPRRDPFTMFLVVACIVLAVLVIVLARQNRQLKASFAALAASQVPADALKTGDRVEPFAILGEGARKERLEFSPDGPKTLLLVFSTHCPACERTLPIWNEFLTAGPPAGLRAVGVETDHPGAAPELGGIVPPALGFPVFSVEQPSPPVLGKIPYVPATVLLDGHGRVVKVWFGIPTKEQLGELRDLVTG